MTTPLLTVENLDIRFQLHDKTVHAVRNISFKVAKGETLALVGESGSGKSVTAMSLMRLLPENSTLYGQDSRITFDGTSILDADEKTLRSLRGGRISFIFQEPMTSLNPFMKIGTQLTEALRVHNKTITRKAARERILDLLNRVGIREADIADWGGRVIVAAVASNLSRIQQVFKAAAETGRRVVLTGFDIENIVRTAIRLKKLSLVDERLLIKPKEMSKFEDHELIILETGRMGEPINGLRKMSIGRHRYVEIKEGDLIYIVTTPSIAKEAVVARVENMIYQAGGIVKLITQNLRVSGHANARDLQLMINLLQPKYLFPIQGEYRGLDAHAKAAMEVGMLPENIFIPKRGSIMEYDHGDFVPAGAVSAGDVMIDGNAIGDVGNIVLRDRKVLSEDGIFIVALTVNRKEKKIISKAKVHTRGFVYVKKSRDILRESSDIINKTVEDYLAQDSFDWGELKGAVRDSLAKYLFDQTKRRPAILPVVMEVR